jgi:two-component system, response regulator PdtaR
VTEGKYIVAAADNPSQIDVRNILNPSGYVYVGNCQDPVSFLRLVRSHIPDFVVVDMGTRLADFRRAIETIDDDMLCSCILLSQYRDIDIVDLLDKSRVVMYCPKPLNTDILLQTVELSLINYKRVRELDKKLREMTENYETRKAVERAKWIIMEKERISEKEAYEKLRNKSMNSRMSMRDVAQSVILANEVKGKY